ncbi:class I SAM-dependent methyltransferase [Mesorhizobium sp. VK4C]|uniref:class I SAM-dependent DNA methyltransferase n=1 Tax=Mesorhizobium captivum TaxID=3072319 RepID=UPI002A23E7CA|nr:class I SAM-dependent methyltransferase [Mesorhizobium sp. VK4C]MDX8499062.1 class I SAM-dependent methyltransferase [Mesorhizobium sp. VK4C]
MSDYLASNQNWASNWASIYEKFNRIRGRVAEADETAAFLERYCHGGSALELGIGDGRVAVPLSERGVRVEGIDSSDGMLKLLAKRTDLIKAWRGDMANFRSEQRYDLVYCAYNTLTALLTREAQISCLRSAAEAIRDEGALVIELPVPAMSGFVGGQKTTTTLVDDENTFVTTDIHNPLNQSLASTLLWFSGTSVRSLPYRARYVYHQELDTMAECAGLKLAERWGDWTRGEFNEGSKRHISVYRRA